MEPKPQSLNIEEFNNLIHDIYDAALDQSCWPTVLIKLVKALNSNSGLIRTQDLQTNQVSLYITQGLDPTFAERYKQHYINIDTLVPTLASQPVGIIEQSRTLMPNRFF
jgi:hypothetical protein